MPECDAPGTTNYAKFQTRNPLVRRLIDGFFSELTDLVAEVRPASVLDAGCGEGEGLARLGELVPPRSAAVDVSQACVAFTSRRLPALDVRQASVLELPFEDRSFELVLCLEVLEHLEDPRAALRELARVSSGALIVSVPHEPYFRVGSLLRGKYLGSLGNHPEHVQRFSKRRFRDFLEGVVEPVELLSPFPWLMAHCRVGGSG